MNSQRAPKRAPSLPVFRSLLLAACVAGTATPAWSQDAEGRVISLSAGLSLTRDSNVPRASSVSRTQFYGTDSLADTYLKGTVGLNFDRRISQQRLQAEAQVDGFKYNNYDQFDNVGYRAGVNYDWVIGRPLFGQIGAQTYRYEPQIQDGQAIDGGRERNRIDRQFIYLKGGFRFTPSLSLIGGADFDRRRNSLQVFEQSDLDIDGFEGGIRWAPGTGLELDFVYRHSKGDYKSLQNRTINGDPIFGTPLDNDYKQDELLIRATYRPTEETRLTGVIGQTKRDFNDRARANNDFDGITLRGDFEWALTGLTTMRILVARDVEPQDGVWVASYAEATQFAIRPRIQMTGRIKLEPFYHHVNRKYSGELADSRGVRKDKLNLFGVLGTYELTRTVSLFGELRRERRTSNFDYAEFSANIVTLGVQARF